MSVAALLFIKAHSERVPGKNFRLLGDRPLFRWIVDALLEVESVDVLLIDTDARDQVAAGLPDSDRLQVVDRRAALCGDHVTANTLIADALGRVSADTYLMTHATNPLLSAGTMRAALSEYHAAAAADEADSLFSVNRFQTRFYRGDGAAVNHDPAKLVPTQQLEPWFEENSCLYLFSADSFAATGSRIGARPRLFETPKHESLDIDTEADWQLLIRAVRRE